MIASEASRANGYDDKLPRTLDLELQLRKTMFLLLGFLSELDKKQQTTHKGINIHRCLTQENF